MDFGPICQESGRSVINRYPLPASSNMTSDPFQAFKATQRENWKTFAPLATTTTPSAAKLVHFAGVRPNQKVLDVGCGTGVVASPRVGRGPL